MQTHEIIKRFREHFERAGHTWVPSASLISEDPTVLFVIAGMAPFKPYFLGQQTPPYATATSVQKCVRTGDIDEVGKTTRHLTFFQMAGNFSFGDYFKRDAIRHAWTLVTGPTEQGGLGFEPDRIWATVYEADDEAYRLWQEVAGLPPERIQRRSGEDNYWDMGVPGPGGPCSEIYYDRGPEHGAEGGPVVDEDRYLEIWNLVFMQDMRGEQSPKEGYPPVGELPQKNIDTGMGVERVAFLLQGVNNIYETDLMRAVIDKAEQLSGKRYGGDEQDDVRFRVVADHARSGVMLAADGVTPSNEARGYVLRRLLRRIVRSMRLLGVRDPVLGELAATVRDAMSPSYPELRTEFERIESVVSNEERAFSATLAQGSRMFETAANEAKGSGALVLPGDKAFALHDTYGFPIDLTLEMAAEQGLAVDEESFRTLMEEQRARAQADAKARKSGHGDLAEYRALLDANGPTEFLGHTDLDADARVLGLLVDGNPVRTAAAGTDVELVLDRTPFYAEGGGQIADTGTLYGTGVAVRVDDVQKPVGSLHVHRARVLDGELAVDTRLSAHVDPSRRHAIERSHSATHLVHAAVRGAYGKTAAQAGSLNEPGRMRFDFTAPRTVSPDVLAGVEEEVNEYLQDDWEVSAYRTSMDKAMELGAIALFGEKYGDTVRVVDMGEYSRELCGGTHVGRIGQLGLVKLVGDSSVGSGVHRVEALVGMDAMRYSSREHLLVSQLAEQMKVPAEQLPERVESTVGRLRAAEKEINSLRTQAVLASAGSLADKAVTVGGVLLVADSVDVADGGALRALASDVRGRLGSVPGVVALFATNEGKLSFVVATTEAARERGLAAGELVGSFAGEVSGRGGGKPELAQGGGSYPDGVPAAIEALRSKLVSRG